MEKVEYIKLEMESKQFTEQSQKLFRDMLTVWDDELGIYICHPNHIFTNKPVNENSRDIHEINWKQIDVERMLEIGDTKYFFNPFTTKPQFTYVHNRLSHEMKKLMQLKRKAEAIRHLVVLQKYFQDQQEEHLVRGIIRGDLEGYSLAFNPEYTPTVPKSIFERGLRIGGNYY